MDEVERALSLLHHSARISPHLQEAVQAVEREIRRLRGAIDSHRSTNRSPGCGHALHEADNRLWSVLPDDEEDAYIGRIDLPDADLTD